VLMSRLFAATLREMPAGARSVGHALLQRAGFLRPIASRGLALLPLGNRAMAKIEGVIRDELLALGGQPIDLPGSVDPWEAAELCRTVVRSWRQLPRLLFQIRHGIAVDAFTLDADAAGTDERSEALARLCAGSLALFGLEASEAEGMAERCFVRIDAEGDDELVRCPGCGLVAPRATARFARDAAVDEEPAPLQKIATPGCTTIDGLAALLSIPRRRTAKAVFMMAAPAKQDSGAAEQFVFAVVRGDREVSEAKLAATVGARGLRPAMPDEIRATGAVPGYASPVGLPASTLVVVDEEAAGSRNLVAGANEDGYHLLNTNVPRDYQPSMVADIALAAEGDPCPGCGAPLGSVRGTLLARVARLGPWPAKAEGAVFLDRKGKEQPVLVGHCVIELEPMLACMAAAHHDERGLRWPVAVSPYDVHLVSLGAAGTEVFEEAARVCRLLEEAGLEVLFDDREESPGVKFADADLIGIPLRLAASARARAAGGVELKRRDREERVVVALGDLAPRVRAELDSLLSPPS
jgi:prolyl-tRNA synthetase